MLPLGVSLWSITPFRSFEEVHQDQESLGLLSLLFPLLWFF